ncbi:MAG: hypothetical protein R3257_06775, partial [bacterium]|nr:hypothetical protein [bacterium]
SERATGVVFVETPNPKDEIVLVDQRGQLKDRKIASLKNVKVRVGDYLVKVQIQPEYTYEQPLTVRPTERHEVIVPGFGNLRVNGKCKQVEIFQEKKKITKIKCGKIRTLPNGVYDLKIKLDKKYTLDQTVSVFTNTLREIDVKK